MKTPEANSGPSVIVNQGTLPEDLHQTAEARTSRTRIPEVDQRVGQIDLDKE